MRTTAAQVSRQKHRISAYLDAYADRRALTIARKVDSVYQYALVIPAYNEAPGFLDALIPKDAHDLLVILLINAPDNIDPHSNELKTSLALLNSLSTSTFSLDACRCCKDAMFVGKDHGAACRDID